MARPGGDDSNQDKNPVSASGPMAISTSPEADLHRSTVAPTGMA